MGESELGLGRVQDRSQFVDVPVAVDVEGNERGNIQRRPSPLGWECHRGVHKIVVAVDQHASLLRRNDLTQGLFVNVRKIHMDGSGDAHFLVLFQTSCVQDHRVFFLRHFNALLFRQPPLLAQVPDLLRHPHETGVIDQPVGDIPALGADVKRRQTRDESQYQVRRYQVNSNCVHLILLKAVNC